MPSYTFESLLKDVGEKLEIPNLESTVNNNITLTLKNKVDVVLQRHKSQPYLIIACEIADVPGGRYRENIFREALKFNNLNKPHEGIFAFSKKTQKLFIFDMLPFDEITGEQVISVMQILGNKAQIWKEGLDRGNIPTIGHSQPTGGGGLFGIIR